MKKKHLFLLLCLLWLFNIGVGVYFICQDVAHQSSLTTDPAMLSHVLYLGAAALAAVLTFLQFLKFRRED